MTVYGSRQKAWLGKSDDLFGKVTPFQITEPEKLALGAPGSADLVLAIREMHNWQRRGQLEGYLGAIATVLAPGGTFGVVQHRAPADAKAEESAEKGYLPEAWVIAKVEAAGLKLAEKSEINANAKDTKDYEKGVWTLPPNFREGDTDKPKYEAIGESDRMTLRFTKN
jgi:predicted methyltransferase